MNKMDRLLVITIFLSCIFVATSSVVEIKQGAGSDISPALSKAWTTACAAPTTTKILIPKGKFMLKEVHLKGPCKAPIEIQNDATIEAHPDPNAITKGKEWIMVESVKHFTLSGQGIFDGKGAQMAWKQSDGCKSAASCNRLANSFAFNFVNDSTITGITSKDSKLFHMLVFGCNNITFSGITIDAPGDAPNTDGIHIGRSNGVKILKSVIKTGDDCISLGDGSKHVTVRGVTCGPGHGLSIGSLGKYNNEEPVEGIIFNDCTLVGTGNGVRIKSWAGPKAYPVTVTNIHFENIKMQNVTNPVVIDQHYCPFGGCPLQPPSKVAISKVTFKGITGTAWTPEVVRLICSKANPCKEVTIGDINLKYVGPKGQTGGTFGGQPRGNCTNVKPIFTGTQTPRICK